ncbi:hypothetical protein BKA64DRAFT_769427 [Cadophora sp. MPI-SDFR-AT-0126]|nr:hypothetical protein BKA64DRAFT_769427 [Leotiomycetes sp. MPI-SDFR-AT-0126]
MVCQKRLVSHEVTARAKRTRRDYRSDNNKVVCRQASTSCGRQKRSNYSILLSGAALEQGLSMENAVCLTHRFPLILVANTSQDTRQHIARIGHIQSIKFSAMPDKSIEDVCAQHNIQGKHLRLTFRSERRAKKGLSILLGDERVAGMISTNGKSLETQLCVSEVNVRTGMEKCLCSARKLQADIADLEGAFGGLAVERYDVVMEDVQGQDGEPESKMDGVVEVIGNWGRPSGDEQIDCEML